ncbi:unnamed protein product, partial [marine sediment metagenome]
PSSNLGLTHHQRFIITLLKHALRIKIKKIEISRE